MLAEGESPKPRGVIGAEEFGGEADHGITEKEREADIAGTKGAANPVEQEAEEEGEGGFIKLHRVDGSGGGGGFSHEPMFEVLAEDGAFLGELHGERPGGG